MGKTGLTNIGALLAGGAVLLSGLHQTAPPGAAHPALTPTATVLDMGGTMNQLSVPQDTPEFISSYVSDMFRTFVEPSGLCAGGSPGCSMMGVFTPEQIRLVTGPRDMTFDASVAAGLANLDNCLRGTACVVTEAPYTTTRTQPLTDTSFTVVGYSQSATIASKAKLSLFEHPSEAAVNFVFVANPNRPNGGIMARFTGVRIPLLGITFGGATMTNSPRSAPTTTVDVARQYDLISDFPTNPLNVLADLNAIFGYYAVHLRPFSGGTPELQGQQQDSTYYLIPTPILPLLAPVEALPAVGHLLATVLDPPLRVLVEAGYDRTANPGTPQRANLRYFPKAFTTARNVLAAIPAGWDNGIAYLTRDPAKRPFGTTAPPVYGVGGPAVNTGAVDPYGPPTPLARAALPPASRQAEPRSPTPPRAGRKSANLPKPHAADGVSPTRHASSRR